MGLKYSAEYAAPFYESDVFGNMKISNALGVALQISGAQSIELGRSDAWVWENFNLFWAVIEYDIEVTRLPKFNEIITITTEATSYNKFFCYRRFEFLDAKGQILLTIMTTWVLMDKTSRKVSRVIDDIVAPYESEMISKIARPHKFAKFMDEEILAKKCYMARFSDLDMNGHVNNSKYYDWAADMIDFEFQKNHQPKRIFIKYNHEVLYNEEVRGRMRVDGMLTHHKINENAAEIEIEWTDKAVSE
jgi:medium-chain acyl-[acyl-carrier-protein] hydrolase